MAKRQTKADLEAEVEFLRNSIEWVLNFEPHVMWFRWSRQRLEAALRNEEHRNGRFVPRERGN